MQIDPEDFDNEVERAAKMTRTYSKSNTGQPSARKQSAPIARLRQSATNDAEAAEQHGPVRQYVKDGKRCL